MLNCPALLNCFMRRVHKHRAVYIKFSGELARMKFKIWSVTFKFKFSASNLTNLQSLHRR